MDASDAVYLKNFGENIRIRRKEKGWTQRHLSEMLGIQPTAISRIEKGTVSSSIFRMRELRIALDLSWHELFDFESGPSRQKTEVFKI